MRIAVLILAMLVTFVGPAYAQCGSEGVFVFGAYWCPACRTTERFLASNGIDHLRFEVTDNLTVQQYMREQFGATAIPVIVVDGNYRLGYDADWLRNALCIP